MAKNTSGAILPEDGEQPLKDPKYGTLTYQYDGQGGLIPSGTILKPEAQSVFYQGTKCDADYVTGKDKYKVTIQEPAAGASLYEWFGYYYYCKGRRKKGVTLKFIAMKTGYDEDHVRHIKMDFDKENPR